LDEFSCKKCADGWWPTANKSECFELPEQYMKWDSVFAIVPICISLFGVILTLFVIRTFIVHYDTPIVKVLIQSIDLRI